MGLIVCPECKNKISEHADICIYCGAPKNPPTKRVVTSEPIKDIENTLRHLNDLIRYNPNALTSAKIQSLFLEFLEILNNIPSKENDAEYSDDLYFYEGYGFDAKMTVSKNGFTVLKGSKINPYPVPSTPSSALLYRKKCILNGSVGSDFILKKDITFSSISASACFVAGSSKPGTTNWVDSNGVTYKDKNR